MEENHVTSMPRIGDKAPEFKAVTTQGTYKFPCRLFRKLGNSFQSSCRFYAGLYFRIHDICKYGKTFRRSRMQTGRTIC